MLSPRNCAEEEWVARVAIGSNHRARRRQAAHDVDGGQALRAAVEHCERVEDHTARGASGSGLAIGGKAIKCSSPLNALKDTCDRSCY